MQEVLHANIFFFIATIAVVTFTFLLCIVLLYIISILASVRRAVKQIETGAETISEDLARMREFVLAGGLFSQLLSFLSPRRQRARRASPRARRKGDERGEGEEAA